VTDPKEIEKLVEIAEQAREYALKTIIQGVLNERGAIGTTDNLSISDQYQN
jgi:hypothetical protein